MININNYIFEKLHLDKDIDVSNQNEQITVDDPNADSLCEEFNKKFDKKDIVTLGYNLVLGDIGDGKHFFLRPKNNLKLKDVLDKSKNQITHIWLKQMSEFIGGLYIIVSKYSKIDTSSRINNLKRTYYDFFLGDHGELFNNKKDAKQFLEGAKKDYDALPSDGRTYKIMTIEEASKLEGGVYGAQCGDIKFRLHL